MNTETPEILKDGDVIDCKVIAIEPSTIYFDLSPYGTGILYGREYLIARDLLKRANVGDTVSAKIIDLETEDGYIDLSLKEAQKISILNNIENSISTKEVFEIIIKGANRGGLTTNWNGFRGFLPASQLSEANYPKPTSTNKDAVVEELKKFIGQKFKVVISNFDPSNNNVIFSEIGKTANTEISKPSVNDSAITIKVGDVMDGTIIGIVDFGIFVELDNAVQGLVHISQIDWGLVDNPHRFYKVKDTVKVKITEIVKGKYYFSIKALKKNPWENVAKRYKEGDVVTGVVVKYHEQGAFASIEAGVSGLVHISRFKDGDDLKSKLEIGKSYKFKIATLNPTEQKLTLVYQK